MLELSEIKKDLQAKEDLVKALHSEAHKLQYVRRPPSSAAQHQEQADASPLTLHLVSCRAQDEQHAGEVSRFQEELAEAHSQLRILQKQLDEELAKQPLTNQEVRSSADVFHKHQSFFTCSSVGSCRAASSGLVHLA